MKAWSWAGYIFVIGAAVVSLVLFVLGLKTYGQILSFCVCCFGTILAFLPGASEKRLIGEISSGIRD
ncbi:MAG: hypothetical protein Q4B67_08020 [Eubacteriales bacterium]|nr:hypothetical protein [Eubacteriales bacterium]